MPGRDARGPMGEGPMTGRGLGNCSGDRARDGQPAGYFGFRRGLGRGLGRGMGRGFVGRGRGFGFAAGGGPGFFGWGRGYAPGWGYEDNDKALEAQEKYLEGELNRVRSLRERNPEDEA